MLLAYVPDANLYKHWKTILWPKSAPQNIPLLHQVAY